MKRFEKSAVLYIDSDPIIKLLQFDAVDFPIVSKVLDLAYEKNLQMIVSVMTLHEISFAAYSKGNELLVRQYKEFFTRSKGLILREIDAETAQVAARFRNLYDLSADESFRLATAHVCGADVVFTLNNDWQEYLDATVVTLDSLKN